MFLNETIVNNSCNFEMDLLEGELFVENVNYIISVDEAKKDGSGLASRVISKMWGIIKAFGAWIRDKWRGFFKKKSQDLKNVNRDTKQIKTISPKIANQLAAKVFTINHNLDKFLEPVFRKDSKNTLTVGLNVNNIKRTLKSIKELLLSGDVVETFSGDDVMKAKTSSELLLNVTNKCVRSLDAFTSRMGKISETFEYGSKSDAFDRFDKEMSGDSPFNFKNFKPGGVITSYGDYDENVIRKTLNLPATITRTMGAITSKINTRSNMVA